MKITIRTPQMQDYDRFSAIMDQVQQMHVDWRPDVYKPASPLITKELFGELLKGDSWYIAETDGIVVGVLEVFKRHVEGPAQVTKDVLFVSTMAVDEAYRGKGIGHQFFEKVKQLYNQDIPQGDHGKKGDGQFAEGERLKEPQG